MFIEPPTIIGTTCRRGTIKKMIDGLQQEITLLLISTHNIIVGPRSKYTVHYHFFANYAVSCYLKKFENCVRNGI